MRKSSKKSEDQKKRLFENVKLGFLVFISIGIIIGSYFLFWQIQKQNAPQDTSDQNEQLRSEIESLNTKIDELKTSIGESQSETETKVETRVVSSGSGSVAGASSASEISGKVNLNSASATELDSLPGIGPAYAQRIIDYRSSSGGFGAIEEVQNVKGIGPKTFEKMRDLITI